MNYVELKEVGRIIKIARENNKKCATCEFKQECLFSYSCLSNDYKHWMEARLVNARGILSEKLKEENNRYDTK